MRVLVIFCALVSIAIAGGKGKGGKGGKGGKVGKGGKNGKGGKGDNGSNSMESMTTMMGGLGSFVINCAILQSAIRIWYMNTLEIVPLSHFSTISSVTNTFSNRMAFLNSENSRNLFMLHA